MAMKMQAEESRVDGMEHDVAEHSRVNICLVIAYFGRWPAWMDYYWASCAANPQVHWQIFTDAGTPQNLPENVFVRAMTLEELDFRASGTIGYPINLRHPYKVCDLKPAYGEIFASELKDYQYWGYTDLDIIYGRLGVFLELEGFSASDVFTSAPRLVVGHFTIFRNTHHLQCLYRKTPNLQDILQHYECQAFDEKAFADVLKREADSGGILLKRSDIQLDDIVCVQQGRPRFVMLWFRGRLFDVLAFRELAYYHFIKTKYHAGFRIEKLERNCPLIVADRTGIRGVSGSGMCVSLVLTLIVSAAATLPWYLRVLVKRMLPRSVMSLLKAR